MHSEDMWSSAYLFTVVTLEHRASLVMLVANNVSRSVYSYSGCLRAKLSCFLPPAEYYKHSS